MELRKAVTTSTSKNEKSTKTSSATNFKIAKAENTNRVAITNNTFGPVVNVIHAGDTVTWANKDASEHKLVSFPNAPQSFNVDLQSNQNGTHKFTQPGVYRYYGKDSATYSKKMSDVEALKQSQAYPVPMRGVIVVLKKDNTLPASDSAKIDIPDSTMAFTPWNVTVNEGTTVKWSNHDDMPHMVATVPGYASKQTKTLTLKKANGSGQLTFDQPGVYYYYCPMHAKWNTKTGQMTPQKSYGSFPFVMDGLIVVNPKK